MRKSQRLKRGVGRFVAGTANLADPHAFESPRFHIVPQNGWHRFLWKLDIHALNTLPWNGHTQPPKPPCPCFILPASDEIAIVIANEKETLENMGWKTFTCDADIIQRLQNKVMLRDYAERLKLLKYLPQHYKTLAKAKFPCMLKGAHGNHGKTVWMVNSREEAIDVMGVDDVVDDGDWLLQEIVPGKCEYAVSLLVRDGEILDAVETRYEYDRDVYVWPHVEELGRNSEGVIRKEHLSVMRSFVANYTGVCNFNHKLRKNGDMAIFEVNTRIGADLACDVPRDRARVFFEKLSSLSRSEEQFEEFEESVMSS